MLSFCLFSFIFTQLNITIRRRRGGGRNRTWQRQRRRWRHIILHQIQHMFQNLLRSCHMPPSQRPLAAMRNRSRKNSFRLDRQWHNRAFFSWWEEGDSYRWCHDDVFAWWEEECSEHIFVGLCWKWLRSCFFFSFFFSHKTELKGRTHFVVSSTEYKFRVRVLVENSLDNLTLHRKKKGVQVPVNSITHISNLTLLTAVGLTSKFFFPIRTARRCLNLKTPLFRKTD